MFCLRVDLDTAYATPAALENLLPVLRDNNAVASFFIPMGGESNLVELFKTRGKGAQMPKAHSLPKKELLRMLLKPKNYAEENAETLRQAMRQGCTVGCHGWKHREWTRSLETLDVKKTFEKMTEKYVELFGVKPRCFAAPGFRSNGEVLKQLDAFGFKCAGDLEGQRPFRPVVNGRKFKCVQAPVNIRAVDSRPLIEWLALRGKSDSEILRECRREILEKEKKFGYACMYAHDFFECKASFPLVRQVVEFVAREGIEFASVEKAAARLAR